MEKEKILLEEGDVIEAVPTEETREDVEPESQVPADADLGDVVEDAFAAEQAVEEMPVGSEQIVEEKSGKKGKKRKRKKKLKFYEITPENDMKYRGPLSYRHLRIAGWAFMIIAQVATVLALVGKADPAHAPSQTMLSVFGMFKELMMPLLLLATFATILNGSKNFKSMLILYGGASVIFYLLFIIIHERYMANSLAAVMGVDHATAVQTVDTILGLVSGTGFLAFNIFIDLFMCTLLAFFMLYRPKKVFVGKKLTIFRCMIALPILYEIASFTLKILAAYGTIVLTPYLYPLLTTKPPMTFFVFIALTVFLKVRESIYRKKGGTHEQYQAFLKTNANSWRFSSFTAKVLVIAGIIDTIVYFILTVVLLGAGIKGGLVMENEEQVTTVMTLIIEVLTKCGVGQCGGLIIIAPFILLFSYTRTHKNTKIDTLLPIIAIAIIAIMFIEGAYHFVLKAGGRLQEYLQTLIGSGGGGQ